MKPLIFHSGIVIWRIYQFLRFYYRAQTVYQIHSPFVFEIAKGILSRADRIPGLEHLYHSWKNKTTKVKRMDYGAGSSLKIQDTIGAIMKNSVSPLPQCRQWYQLSRLLNPEYILEMGTSLGFSSLFLQAGAKESIVVTMEGDAEMAELAALVFSESKMHPVPRIVQGLFEDNLKAILDEFPVFDLVFIDGNHTCEATMLYWEKIKPNLSNNSVVIIHDIYWSKGMKFAWDSIRNDNRVTASLDFFNFGILLLSNSFCEKHHFSLVPFSWKPYNLGIF